MVALTAIVATVPLQLLASVIGFLARDPVAGTGMGLLAGTWAVAGFATLTSPPGTVSEGLGVVLLVAGLAMLVPAAVAAASKVVPAAVMALAGTRFIVTGTYEITGSGAWKTTAGWVGLALAVVAFYAALALELESVRERTVLPVGRRGRARRPWPVRHRWIRQNCSRRPASDHSSDSGVGRSSSRRRTGVVQSRSPAARPAPAPLEALDGPQPGRDTPWRTTSSARACGE